MNEHRPKRASTVESQDSNDVDTNIVNTNWRSQQYLYS